MPEQPDFNISARIPGATDSERGMAPDWCDLELVISEPMWNGNAASSRLVHLTRAAGESIIDELDKTLRPRALREKLWSDLDVLVDIIVSEGGPELADAETRGKAEGIARAISLLEHCDLDTVRDEAAERHENSQ
jgi:hypothetical protein